MKKYIRATFHLIGGQSISIKMKVLDGKEITKEDLKRFNEWKDVDNLSFVHDNEWAYIIPDMKNVAMIQFEPMEE